MRIATFSFTALTLVVVSLSCKGGSGTTPRNAPSLSWLSPYEKASNGIAPPVTAAGACGSDTATFLAELLNVSPIDAKVNQEWADCVPQGKQVMIAGTVATTHLGPTDLPTSHPFGDDLSMDINIDPEFAPFALMLGKSPSDTGPGQMHVEISSGFIPHVPRPANPDMVQTWRAASDFNLDPTSFQPGFDLPAIGDRILIMGRWIIDCGHDNFGSELHAMSFLAWTHSDGHTTTLHTYFNPYRDTELYENDPTVLGKVEDTGRLATAKQFPPYLVTQIEAINGGQTDRLRSLELVEATHASPAPFVVCAPAGTSGKSLALHYDVVTRPGVAFDVTPDTATGCVLVEPALGPSYTPLDATIRQCILPWTYLDQIAGGMAGNPNLDLLSYIDMYVTNPQAKQALAQDPLCSCADALAGPIVTASPTGKSIRTDGTQPFPFYGVVTVGWSNSG